METLQTIKFLDLVIDTIRMTLSLTEQKVERILKGMMR